VYASSANRQPPNGELTLDRGQAQVEAMMQRRVSFSAVEDAIDTAQLPSQHKAALWLLAWSLRDTRQQLQDARLTLAAVGKGELGGG
jgi:hypothetical protein